MQHSRHEIDRRHAILQYTTPTKPISFNHKRRLDDEKKIPNTPEAKVALKLATCINTTL